MAIECLGRREFYVECDECGIDESLEATSFEEAVEEVKGLGWRATTNVQSGSWENICPECSEFPDPVEVFK